MVLVRCLKLMPPLCLKCLIARFAKLNLTALQKHSGTDIFLCIFLRRFRFRRLLCKRRFLATRVFEGFPLSLPLAMSGFDALSLQSLAKSGTGQKRHKKEQGPTEASQGSPEDAVEQLSLAAGKLALDVDHRLRAAAASVESVYLVAADSPAASAMLGAGVEYAAALRGGIPSARAVPTIRS